MHVTGKREWPPSPCFLLVNTHQERRGEWRSENHNQWNTTHTLSECKGEGNTNKEGDEKGESQNASEAWGDESHHYEKNSVQWVWGLCMPTLKTTDLHLFWVKTMCDGLLKCVCVCVKESDKLWQLQWACFIVMTKPNPCSIYPLLQYPWPTPGVPNHTITQRERRRVRWKEHQVVRRLRDMSALHKELRKNN